MSKRTRSVDSAKLSAHLRARNLNKALVSQEMGYSPGYLNHCIERGKIGRNAALILEAKYGISPDSYDPETPFELPGGAGSLTPSSMRSLIDYAVEKLLDRFGDCEIVISIRDKTKKECDIWRDTLRKTS